MRETERKQGTGNKKIRISEVKKRKKTRQTEKEKRIDRKNVRKEKAARRKTLMPIMTKKINWEKEENEERKLREQGRRQNDKEREMK